MARIVGFGNPGILVQGQDPRESLTFGDFSRFSKWEIRETLEPCGFWI